MSSLIHQYGEFNQPIEIVKTSLSLDDLTALKENIDNAIIFLNDSKGLMENSTYILLITYYHKISQMYQNMITTVKYNMLSPDVRKGFSIKQRGENMVIFEKSQPRIADPSKPQMWEKQFEIDPESFDAFTNMNLTISDTSIKRKDVQF